jgi:MFS family permease
MSATTVSRRRSFGLHRYAPVLHAPHALSLAAGSYVSRAGQAGGSLAVLLAVRHATGSFGAAGTAAGLTAACAAGSRVLQGRLMDRLGHARVLLPLTLVQLLMNGALAVAVAERAGALLLIVLSALLGATLPAVSAMMRTLWALLLPDEDLRTVASTLESLVTELSFMTGPALAGVLATAVSPTAALIAMGALTAAGTAVVTATGPSRAWRPHPREHADGGALARPLVAPVTIALAIGLAAGAVDVSAPAFATLHHAPGATGALLAIWAAGSLVGGVWYGARHWRPASRELRLVGCLTVFTLGLALLPLASSPLGLGALLVLTGLPIAPALTTVYLLVDERVPRERVTEAFAWVSSALPAGASLGTVLAGWIVAGASPRAGFLTGAALSLLAILAALAALRSAQVVRRMRA